MSPLLFLKVVEGLSRLIDTPKRSGILNGIKLGRDLSISHLLFVDDALLFGVCSIIRAKYLKEALGLCSLAKGMEINLEKSPSSFDGMSERQVRDVIPFQIVELNEGMKYLGFFLRAMIKASGIGHGFQKNEKRITSWCTH